MLNIHREQNLAKYLGLSVGEMRLSAELIENDIHEFTIWNPNTGEKPRDVINVVGGIRKIQGKLLDRLFRPRLQPSQWSHGSVKGRSIRSNAMPHADNRFFFQSDIRDFFGSISTTKLNLHFRNQLNCSVPVARLLTRFCSYEHHLALGLLTSPILAEQILADADRRIAVLCETMGLTYTRYVDDLTISGPYELAGTQILSKVDSILNSCGLRLKQSKTGFADRRDGVELPGIRIRRDGKLDVPIEYIDELTRIIDDHRSLSSGNAFDGPLHTYSQLAGKVHYALWVNPGRWRQLKRRFSQLDWDAIQIQAKTRGLLAAKVKKTARGESAPSFAESYGRQS